jgi:hypothetical protein
MATGNAGQGKGRKFGRHSTRSPSMAQYRLVQRWEKNAARRAKNEVKKAAKKAAKPMTTPRGTARARRRLALA